MLAGARYRAALVTLAGAALFLSSPSRAQETSATLFVDPALVAEVSFGLNCRVEIVGTRAAPGTERGEVDVFDTPPEISPLGQIVPAVMGLGFGVRARAADGVEINGALFRVTHPPFAGTGTTEQSWAARYIDSAFSTHLYRFDFPYEMVTGTWVMESTYEGRTLYRIPFTVVPPEAFPGADSLCDPSDMLSGLAAPVHGPS